MKTNNIPKKSNWGGKLTKRIIGMVLSIAMLASVGTTVMAEDVGSDYKDMSYLEKVKAFEDNFEVIESYIKSKGTNTLDVLREEKQYLEELKLQETTSEQIVRLENLINNYSKQINEYEMYLKAKLNPQQNINTYGIWHPVYSPAVASISAYFVVQGYRLSAELLMHAENTTDSRTFTPYWGDNAKQTVEFSNRVNAIRPGTSGSGSSGFTSMSTTAEADMYYAIHLYNYTYNTSGTRVFVINDTYNFEPSIYDGVAGAAVNTMWLAQQFGTITAYPVQIAIYF